MKRILQQAIARHLRDHPQTQARFRIQWTGDFRNEAGALVTKDPALLADERVEFITEYFREGECSHRLVATDIMLLPYRVSSYGLRGSRIVIEAMVNGIPAVVTNGTTLATQAALFGAVVPCENGSVESLCAAKETAVRTYPLLRAHALEQMPGAREHFSVKKFRKLLLAKTNRG